jgi:hypothetical protein
MNKDTGVERLHAFVDGQLNTADKARLLEDMERDAALRQQVCELQRLKEYVSIAFEEPPAAPVTWSHRRWLPWGQGVAALLLLAVGFLAGHWSQPSAPQAVAGSMHVILHVNAADNDKFLLALADAEALAATGGEARVEVVANAGGLDLMRSDRSPLIGKVRALMDKYPNIQFVACNIALGKQRQLGQEPVLIQGIQVTPSAAEHILRRMEEGWAYTRV